MSDMVTWNMENAEVGADSVFTSKTGLQNLQIPVAREKVGAMKMQLWWKKIMSKNIRGNWTHISYS